MCHIQTCIHGWNVWLASWWPARVSFVVCTCFMSWWLQYQQLIWQNLFFFSLEKTHWIPKSTIGLHKAKMLCFLLVTVLVNLCLFPRKRDLVVQFQTASTKPKINQFQCFIFGWIVCVNCFLYLKDNWTQIIMCEAHTGKGKCPWPWDARCWWQ